MKAVVTYDLMLVTDSGSIAENRHLELFDIQDAVEGVYRKKNKIESNSQWQVRNIRIDFVNE